MATDLSRLRLLPALWLATAPVWAFGPAGADVPFASAPASPAAETGAVAVVSNAVQAAATNAPASKPHASDAAPKAPDAKRAGLGGLTNRVWKLTALTGLDTLPAGAEVTLTVAGGRVSGRSACNHYFGRAKAEDSGALAVDGIGSTLMACEEPIISWRPAISNCSAR